MSSGKLVTKHAFGVRVTHKNCLKFFDDHHLLYVCGNNVVVLNTETKDQSFINGTTYPSKSLGITCISTCHHKKLIAIAEKTNENGIVTLYDSHSLKRKKFINHAELGSKEIIATNFSDDGKYFIMQGGAPEWNLCLWNIEKNVKLVYSYKVCHYEEQTVSSISFCPSDHSIIAVFGKSIGKFLKYQEGHIKPMSMSLRRDHANFTSHVWLNDDRCVIGTEGGEILLIENGDFKTVVYPCGNDNEDFVPILSLSETSRGFAVGTVSGEIRIFEKADENKEQYTHQDTYNLPNETSNIISLAMGLDDNVICLTDSQQLFNCPLYSSNILVKDKSAVSFDFLISSFHSVNSTGNAAIISMDVSMWKPLLVTVGKDCSVRVWNLSDRKLEVMTTYPEEPVSVALHPSGLYMVVAFMDKLKVISILLNELLLTREIPVRQCSTIKFSNGGSFIAANSGSSINIFNFFTGEMVSSLRGHSSKIRSISWLNFDSRICSVGSEGAVFYWDIFPANKRVESLTSPLHFTSGVSFSDSSKAFVSLPEKIVKEYSIISQVDGEPLGDPRDLDVGSFISSMIVDDSKKLLFVGTADDDVPNSIMSFLTFPQLNPSNEAAVVHSGAITSMCISHDGNHIYSADSDGIIIISEVDGAGTSKMVAGAGGVSSSFEFVDEVLVKKHDYEDKKHTIEMLLHTIEELTLNNEHSLRLKEMEHKNKIKVITNDNLGLLSMEKMKHTNLMEEKKNIEDTFNSEMTSMDGAHEQRLVSIDIKYKAKLNAEAIRQRQLNDEITAIQIRWNEENQALVESHQDYIRELTEEYEEKLKVEQNIQRKIQSDKEALEVHFDLLQKQIDVDADDEVDEMKVKYAQRLKFEEDTVMALMSEHAILKKSLQTLGKDAQKQKADITKLNERELRLLETIHSLEKDIVNHKKEIREREETVTDKEKRIFELKKKNQELEKFRFVLDYKIKELKMQIAPREAEIATMRKQIEDMDLELEQYHKSNSALNLMISELKLKADGMKTEFSLQSDRYEMNSRIITKYRRDLKELLAEIENNAVLKSKIILLFRTYVQDDASNDDSGKPSKKLEDPQLIYNRDREQLERSLEALRRAAKGDARAHKRDVTKMLRENVILTNELNDLRKNYVLLSLKKKAVDESGALQGKPFNDIFDILGVKDPADKYKKMFPTDSNPNAGGIFATEGVKEMISPSRGKNSPRTSALRATDAGGKSYDTSPTSGRKNNDQWEAWREIQMQNDQLQHLEGQLRQICSVMYIDPDEILIKIDESINNNI